MYDYDDYNNSYYDNNSNYYDSSSSWGYDNSWSSYDDNYNNSYGYTDSYEDQYNNGLWDHTDSEIYNAVQNGSYIHGMNRFEQQIYNHYEDEKDAEDKKKKELIEWSESQNRINNNSFDYDFQQKETTAAKNRYKDDEDYFVPLASSYKNSGANFTRSCSSGSYSSRSVYSVKSEWLDAISQCFNWFCDLVVGHFLFSHLIYAILLIAAPSFRGLLLAGYAVFIFASYKNDKRWKTILTKVSKTKKILIEIIDPIIHGFTESGKKHSIFYNIVMFFLASILLVVMLSWFYLRKIFVIPKK